MARVNKYTYLHVVQGNYIGYWEDLTASENRNEMKADLKAYQESDSSTAYRIIKRRELNAGW